MGLASELKRDRRVMTMRGSGTVIAVYRTRYGVFLAWGSHVHIGRTGHG
jgi:hypothetical protein